MNKQELTDQLKYSSSQELLVLTWYNQIKRLFCPFEVLVLIDIGELARGQVVFVEQVKVTMELKTVFVVDGSAYYYYHFNILID